MTQGTVAVYATNQSLIHPVDFDNAMWFLTKVCIWKDGTLVDTGGFIDGHDDEGVMVNGNYFPKAGHEFRVRE